MPSIGQKADYVRAKITEGRAGNHHCHWPGCERKVPPAQWGCRRHWYMLPQALRNKIWRAYRPGQEINKTPSASYIEISREVHEWIRAQPSQVHP